ncbi:helix-turn-helix transcriptional regulator [Nocardioides sp. CGMCC 1.13656]|uniref:winged helix-turn-helix transcriptional regulator n=1 Tax=Nocardioides TaxID=1839 RepID=UPI0015EBF1D4|nr:MULTISPECIES: helix-turn-helix domain-containing protein [unclassified Nocardioides]MBA2954806.1 helix-turn-helix transcriptional regulator [Nocardioides sp. CGMCC 1.13656]
MVKRYEQYCPMAHALDMVGDRWALLIVRDLMHGPQRYTDLVERLPGIGTNILAARLRELEAHGIVTRRTLPPPAASRVYDLTDYGRALRPALRELALWGARSLGPPTDKDELFQGWLANAMDTVIARLAPNGRFEFRCGEETASLVDGEVLSGPIEHADVVVEGDPDGIYYLFVNRSLDTVTVDGDQDLLLRLLDAAPERVEAPASA